MQFDYSNLASLCSGEVFYLPSCTITNVPKPVLTRMREYHRALDQIGSLFTQATEEVNGQVRMETELRFTAMIFDQSSVRVLLDHGRSLKVEIVRDLHPIELHQRYMTHRDVGNVSSAFCYLQQLAEKTAEKSYQLELGICYEDGIGVPVDLQEALLYYQLAANQGLPAAQLLVGRCYRYGFGVHRKNSYLAIHYYTLAAKGGELSALVALGEIFQESQKREEDAEKSMMYFVQAADKGHLGAQYRVGTILLRKEDDPKSQNKGIEYLQSSADKGYAPAQYQLGLCYERGEGVNINFDQMFRNYKLAADQGYIQGQSKVGICSMEGRGTQQDLKTGIYYLTLAADQGDPDALFNLGLSFESGKGVIENSALAIQYYQLAAEKGSMQASQALNQVQPQRKTSSRICRISRDHQDTLSSPCESTLRFVKNRTRNGISSLSSSAPSAIWRQDLENEMLTKPVVDRCTTVLRTVSAVPVKTKENGTFELLRNPLRKGVSYQETLIRAQSSDRSFLTPREKNEYPLTSTSIPSIQAGTLSTPTSDDSTFDSASSSSS